MFTEQSLNTVHIANELASYEAARNAFFVFYVGEDQLTNLYAPNFDPDSGEGKVEDGTLFDAHKAGEALKLNVVKASVPNFTVEPMEYRRGNDVIKFAGVPSYKDGSITVDDVVGKRVKDLLYAWQYLAYNPITRKGGRMKDYKKTCTLIEYTQDYEIIRRWTMYGCFITGIDEGEFDRENDGKRQLTVSISYDRATIDLDDNQVIANM